MKVVIDAGHGGYDSGAVRGSIREKDIVLDIALKLREKLERAGVEVIMTRTTDVSPSGDSNKNNELAARTRIANSSNADVFISLHINAGGGKGAEVFVYKDGGTIRPLATKIVDNIGAIVGGTRNPKVKDGSLFYVINATKMPAILVEFGFIDSSDIDVILTKKDELAEAVAKGILDHYGIKEPVPVPVDIYKDVPEWAKGAVKKAHEKGVVTDTKGSNDFYRFMVVLDNLGLFDK